MDTVPTYSIRDWSKHFENNRTRELKELRFVILPNKQDGDGYTELLDHENGAAHYGAWCALVQVASKCEPRGVLIRSVGTIPQGVGTIPQGGAVPHDSRSLSRLTRIPAGVFDEVFPRLVSIGWLVIDEMQAQQNQPDRTIPQGVGTIPHPPAEKCPRIEQNRKEEGALPEPLPFSSPAFLEAWSDYEQARKEKRQRITPTIRKALCKKMRLWGEDRSIAALIHSTGYTGLFEPKNGNGATPPTNERPSFMASAK